MCGRKVEWSCGRCGCRMLSIGRLFGWSTDWPVVRSAGRRFDRLVGLLARQSGCQLWLAGGLGRLHRKLVTRCGEHAFDWPVGKSVGSSVGSSEASCSVRPSMCGWVGNMCRVLFVVAATGGVAPGLLPHLVVVDPLVIIVIAVVDPSVGLPWWGEPSYLRSIGSLHRSQIGRHAPTSRSSRPSASLGVLNRTGADQARPHRARMR